MALVLDDLPFLRLADPAGAIGRALVQASASFESFPDATALAWLAKLQLQRPAVLTSSRTYSLDALDEHIRSVRCPLPPATPCPSPSPWSPPPTPPS